MNPEPTEPADSPATGAITPEVLGGLGDLGAIDNPLAALFGRGDGDGGFDISGLLAQAQSMQENMAAAQAEAASIEVEGQAGGGVVRIVATAGLEPLAVHIAPEAVDPDDVSMLEDLVLAALRDLIARANEVQAEAFGGVLGG